MKDGLFTQNPEYHKGERLTLKVVDDDKEYSLGEFGDCLIVQDLCDAEDCVQVDAKDFSMFEHSVWCFLQGER
jgi:hypothetical protein